jgi:hypothetical protein
MVNGKDHWISETMIIDFYYNEFFMKNEAAGFGGMIFEKSSWEASYPYFQKCPGRNSDTLGKSYQSGDLASRAYSGKSLSSPISFSGVTSINCFLLSRIFRILIDSSQTQTHLLREAIGIYF